MTTTFPICVCGLRENMMELRWRQHGNRSNQDGLHLPDRTKRCKMGTDHNRANRAPLTDETPAPLWIQRVLAHEPPDLFGVHDNALMAQFGAQTPIATGFERWRSSQQPWRRLLQR